MRRAVEQTGPNAEPGNLLRIYLNHVRRERMSSPEGTIGHLPALAHMLNGHADYHVTGETLCR